MKKRLAQVVITAALVSTMVVTPVFATPSVEDMQGNKAAVQSEVNSLQSELTTLLDKIATLESNLSTKQEEIEKASVDLEEATNQQSKQYDAMKLRIKYLYEEGDSSFVETLITAKSFTDLVNKAEYVQDVHQYDRDKLNEFVATTEKVETLKTDLQKEATTLQATRTELETEKSTLNSTIENRQEEVAQLDQSIQDAVAAQQAAAAEAAAQQAAQQAAVQQAAADTGGDTGGGSTNGGGNTSGGGSSSGGSSNSGSSGGGSSYAPPQGMDGWAVVSYARQFLGNPYVYGGNSLTNGIDCSGFTQQIYAAFGVSIGRTSYAQEGAGYAISFSQAQAGDLIVYDGHVGIYNGSGGLIHASSPSVGIVESGSCTYRPILSVRRVL